MKKKIPQAERFALRKLATDIHAKYIYANCIKDVDHMVLSEICKIMNESLIPKLRGTEPWTADDVSDLKKRLNRCLEN